MKKMILVILCAYVFLMAAVPVGGVTFDSPISPLPTPVPVHTLEIENLTGGQVCLNIMDSGIGSKCFGDGRHTYGTFPAGEYHWFIAESPCELEGFDYAGYGDYQPYGSIWHLRCKPAPQPPAREAAVSETTVEDPSVEAPVVLLPMTGGTQ